MTDSQAPVAPLFADIDDVSRRLAQTGYLPDTATATAVFLADRIVVLYGGQVVEQADGNRVLAMQDELTGLTNRRSILGTLEQQLAMARRNGQPLSLLMLDLDHFKRVNDSFGHLAGDAVLRQVAAGIASRLRAQDVAGRYGG